MIISHHQRFIFIKTGKTGGTSVEIALSRFCGDDDVITAITPRDERVRIAAGRTCQNFSSFPELERRYVAELSAPGSTVSTLPEELVQGRIYYNHMSISELNQLHPDLLDRYAKITVERHPYEKAVSYANFVLRYREYLAGDALIADLAEIRRKLDDLIDSGELAERVQNWRLYTIDGRVRVDHVLQHATLQKDFSRLCRELGLDGDQTLPATKVGTWDKSIPAGQILTSGQREFVRKACHEEFGYFGYAT